MSEGLKKIASNYVRDFVCSANAATGPDDYSDDERVEGAGPMSDKRRTSGAGCSGENEPTKRVKLTEAAAGGLETADRSEIIESYFDSFPVGDGVPKSGNVYFEDYTDPPNDGCFCRDGEKVSYVDRDDFFLQTLVKSLECTLKLFERKADATKNPNFRMSVKMVARDLETLEKKSRTDEYYKLLVNCAKNLVLNLDTCRFHTRLLANQMWPVSCCLTETEISRACSFGGFREVNDYGYVECNVCVGIRFVFHGTLETQRSDETGSTTLLIHPTRYLGEYFNTLVRNVYNVCFNIISRQVDSKRYEQKKRELGFQHRGASFSDRGNSVDRNSGLGALVAAMDFPRTCRRETVSDFFRDLPEELIRRETPRFVGTGGRMNSDNRLVFNAFNKDLDSFGTSEPEDDVDAVFVSSCVRFRISGEGIVYMDIYSRSALKLDEPIEI